MLCECFTRSQQATCSYKGFLKNQNLTYQSKLIQHHLFNFQITEFWLGRVTSMRRNKRCRTLYACSNCKFTDTSYFLERWEPSVLNSCHLVLSKIKLLWKILANEWMYFLMACHSGASTETNIFLSKIKSNLEGVNKLAQRVLFYSLYFLSLVK